MTDINELRLLAKATQIALKLITDKLEQEGVKLSLIAPDKMHNAVVCLIDKQPSILVEAKRSLKGERNDEDHAT
jgi:hypothetical protein